MAAVEDPSYFLAFQIFRDHGMVVQPLKTTSTGIDLDALEEALASGAFRPRLVYTIPTFNNPCSFVTDLQHRYRLIELAHQYDFYVVADEVYQLIYFDVADRPPLPLAMLEHLAGKYEEGRVISTGSLAKSLSPGLRVGYVHSMYANITSRFAQCGYTRSGGAINHFTTGIGKPGSSVCCNSTGVARTLLTSGTVSSLLKSGKFHSNLQDLRREYHSRCDVIIASLESLSATVQERGEELVFLSPKGGYFIWVQLPSSVTAQSLLNMTRTSVDVRFLEGSRCSCASDRFPSSVRLCYAHYNAQQLMAAMEEFSRLLIAALNEKDRE